MIHERIFVDRPEAENEGLYNEAIVSYEEAIVRYENALRGIKKMGSIAA